MFDRLSPLTVTPRALHEQVQCWLQSLSSMRVLGEENYRVEWQRVERAYDYLRLLDLDDAPAEPAKPSELSIAGIIAALQPVEEFLRNHLDKLRAKDEEFVDYRAGGVAGGEPLTVAFVKKVFGWHGTTLARNVDRIEKPTGSGYLYQWKSLVEYGQKSHVGVDVESAYRKWQSSACKVCR